MAAKYSLPEKKELVENLMEKGTVLLHLDPRKEGVVIPPWLGGQPQLVLQIGYHMPIPIPDLRIDEGGVAATLSFNRSAYSCFVPWSSIFAVVGDDGRGTSWPDDLPAEIVAEIEREIRRAQIKKAPDLEKAIEKISSDLKNVVESQPTNGQPKKRASRKAVRPQPVYPASYDSIDAIPKPQSTIMSQTTPAAPASASLESNSQRPLNTGRPGFRGGKVRTLPPYLRVIK